ncbi:hypothetical protein BGX24_002980 [Mortierella sp. AD032]|nr:hypothetical protein BGX24_002980 [Mortierella sp. AD032]
MSRSLSSSLLVVLALTLFVLQGVLAAIRPGLYAIAAEDDLYLSIGPVPPIFPPPDVPARLFRQGESREQVWEVKLAPGGYTIRQPGDRPFTYGLIQKYDAVFVSSEEARQPWAVEEAGDNLYTIRAPYDDLLFTQTPEKSVQVHLKPATGAGIQRWRFVPILEYSRPLGRLYGKSRFNLQCAM